jgi:hypothetical protein
MLRALRSFLRSFSFQCCNLQCLEPSAPAHTSGGHREADAEKTQARPCLRISLMSVHGQIEFCIAKSKPATYVTRDVLSADETMILGS